MDSRAGYDELIAATHIKSDVTISVEEPDDISKITSDNLVDQLRKDSDTPLFRLTNKARNSQNLNDRKSVTDLGSIPFDMDVLKSYGSIDFWETIQQSMYRYHLAQCWNRLAAKMNLSISVREPRISPMINQRIERKLGVYSLIDRVFLLYGLIALVLGTVLVITGKDFSRIFYESEERHIGLLAMFMGIFMVSWVTIIRKRR